MGKSVDEKKNPVLDQGTYEILQQRLSAAGQELQGKIGKLDSLRKDVFGGVESKLVSSDRISTEFNCTPRDLIPVGDGFLFGYNIHLGLKTTTELEDVFAYYERKDGVLVPRSAEFFGDASFRRDFADLYKYYKNTQFAKFAHRGAFLYFVFQVGREVQDIKTFKWRITPHGLEYIDNRSESEFAFPPQHGFTWVRTHRGQHRGGANPHISIEDKVFVETVGGDLTIKIEDNTSVGSGIYAEPVENKDQVLDDAEIFYAIVGNLVLLKIRPYMETSFRYIVFNGKTKACTRIDAIGHACVLLPEDHGILFANGIHLQSGETRLFDTPAQDMLFEERLASPNGEDFLYVFHNRSTGQYSLLSYNLIAQKAEIPLQCHGYAVFTSGELLLLRAEEEPRKHHVVQLWQTPFFDSAAEQIRQPDHFLAKLGNKTVVRAMAECQELCNLVRRGDGYENLYMDLVRRSGEVLDAYFWLDQEPAFALGDSLRELRTTATSAVDEFEKVLRIRTHTAAETQRVLGACTELLARLQGDSLYKLVDFVEALAQLRALRGEIIALKDLRYADIEGISAMEARAAAGLDDLSVRCTEFLLQPQSLDDYTAFVDAAPGRITALLKGIEAQQLETEIDAQGAALQLLIDIISNLKIADPTQTTAIIERISALFARLNQTRGQLKKRKRDLQGAEIQAGFHAQVALLDQGLANYLDLAQTPEKCDEFLSQLMVQVEDLEAKVVDFDEFAEILNAKREEVYTAFDSKKLELVEARNRRAEGLLRSAERILQTILNRVAGLKTVQEIHGYLASDLMVDKVRQTIAQLREMGDSTKADDLTSRLKTLGEDGLRQLKDRMEIYEGGDQVLRLGRHRFSVNTQKLEVTSVLRDGQWYYHVAGTRFFELMADGELETTRSCWEFPFASENGEVYRAEFLAHCCYRNWESTQRFEAISASASEVLLTEVQQIMNSRPGEGYVKGIHDLDAARIASTLLEIRAQAGLLAFPATLRNGARLFWTYGATDSLRQELQDQLAIYRDIAALLGEPPSRTRYEDMLQSAMDTWSQSLPERYRVAPQSGKYLFLQLQNKASFPCSREAAELARACMQQLKKRAAWDRFQARLQDSELSLVARLDLAMDLIGASTTATPAAADICREAALLLLDGGPQSLDVAENSLQRRIEGLSGEHSRLQGSGLDVHLTEFLQRLSNFEAGAHRLHRQFQQRKSVLLQEFSTALRLDEFRPRVLSSFVRNKLLDSVFLPLIGDNLAKQIGVVGEQKRTDLMGLLLLISPPGYGKTTLMEYVSSRLGITFVKINGPALGHRVISLDPAEAPNASAAEEVKKANLAFEMGDNVMLYIDDIQHCNSEFLQKFISLCDGQRRIEGVYKGRSRTYDLRGRKFAVVMAGNPYTESGERFQIPDMLANRADTYNLGDIIGNSEAAFRMSYVENSLSSNVALAPIATRGSKDIYPFLQLAQTGEREGLEFEVAWSPEETREIVAVLQKMIAARDILLQVNQQYILSAAQADDYRTEPPFKLQGSYRNMSKLAEKILPVMNDAEFRTLIAGHYENEAQTLTTGAEFNLLRLREMLGWASPEDRARLADIREAFKRNLKVKNLGGDSMSAILGELDSFNAHLSAISRTLESGVDSRTAPAEQPTSEEFTPEGIRHEVERLIEELQPLRSMGEVHAADLKELRKSINRIIWTYRSFIRQSLRGAQEPEE